MLLKQHKEIEKQKYHTVGSAEKSNRNIAYRGRIDAPNTHTMYIHNRPLPWIGNRIGGIMVSVLASSAVDCGVEP